MPGPLLRVMISSSPLPGRNSLLIDSSFPRFDEYTEFLFPPVESSSEEGIVAMGGNLSPGMLLSAYRQGIFPWYSAGEPVLWWSPNPRMVLFPKNLHVSKSMLRTFKRNHFTYSLDHDFESVMRSCGSVKRKGQDATWISEEMIEGYTLLHRLGYAHSVEVRRDGILVGGLYGLSLGSIFFGESMFQTVADASKAGYILLVRALEQNNFSLVDCQVYTEHLASLGAETIERNVYMDLLRKGLESPPLKGDWSMYIKLEEERERCLRTSCSR